MIFEEIKNELVSAKEKLQRKQKLKNLIDQTKEALEKQKDKRSELAELFEDEQRDVKKLEETSLKSLFYTMLGSKEEQLQTEKQELLLAKLKLDECGKAVKDLDCELATLQEEMKSLNRAEEDYQTALECKEEYLLGLKDGNAERIHQLMDRIAESKMEQKELQEAIEAGEAVESGLQNVIDSLQSAEGWGTWDILGGGIISGAMKHERIDEAKEYVSEVSGALSRFQRELSDVDIMTDLEIPIDSFDKFADFFFDGLITDWVVQSKIHESLDGVETAAEHVESVLASLRAKHGSVTGELKHAEEELKLLVEQA